MNELSHFYSRYGQAILAENVEETDDANASVKDLLNDGLDNFRLKAGLYEGVKQTEYSYVRLKKGNPSVGEYLSPSVIVTDLKASSLWTQIEDLINKIDSEGLNQKASIKQSFAPMTGEYNNGKSRHTPSSTLLEAACCAITTTTTLKPSISFRGTDGKYTNHCIIPELPLEELQDFIALFKKMLVSNLSSTLFVGKVSEEKKKKSISYKPRRPEIYYGNFVNPPKSSYLAVIGIIAAIAEWAKEADEVPWANKILDSLKDTTLYLITYGDAKPVHYNHYVIELAKRGKLKTIIDSIYYTSLYGKSRFNYSVKEDQIEYQKFDLFANRFLQLFSKESFSDFLSFRASYPYELNELLTTYFLEMEKIDNAIIDSARDLGKWLNRVAYFTAKSNKDNKTEDKIRTSKAKILIELESSMFSAKSGDAMIAQVITRAGRLSGFDAPPEAELYISKTCSGELSLGQAKNLLMAFSRLRREKQKSSEEE